MPHKTLYSGISVVEIASLDEFFLEGRIAVKALPRQEYFPNQNLVLKGEHGSGLAIVKGDFAVRVSESSASGIKPRSKEQIFALNMLMDPAIKAVTLTGNAGTGKTLLAIAAALQQSTGAKAQHRKIVYIKSIVPVGEKIGFLPGTLDEKIDPFFGALYDSMELMVKPGKDFDKMIGFDDKAKIQKMAASFVRGRTMRKTFVIIDEAQNFSIMELKTMLTRVDEDSKVVILGDVDQVDVILKPEHEGLVRVVETFKDHELFGHINLIKSERSKLAQLVSDRL